MTSCKSGRQLALVDHGRGAPERVLKAPPSDQVAHLFGAAAGPRADGTSIANKRQNLFDANALQSPA